MSAVVLLLCAAVFVEGLHSFINNWFSAAAMALAAAAALLVLTGGLR